MRPGLVTLLAAGLLLAARGADATEPWSDPDPAGAPSRLSLGGSAGFRGGLEYRANALLVRPLDLSSTRDRNISLIEHRLRLDGQIDWEDKIRVATSVDVLDGVLWGDNGSLGSDPEPTTGANVSTSNPNISTACIRVRPGEPTTLASSYHYGLCGADPVFVRRLYGDVVTPIGLFRIGRQAFTEGASIAVNDGDGRKNRFGFARRGNSVDRVLFATKPLKGFKPAAERDKSETKGFFLILAYDRLVTDDPMKFSDDLHNYITAVRLLAPRHPLGTDAELRFFHAYRWSKDNGTAINAFGGRAMSTFGEVTAGLEATLVAGSTREVSEAFRLITNDPAVSQAITQVGARGVVRWDKKLWSAYLEADYASGDSDPQTRPRSRSSALPRTRTSASSCSSTCSRTRRRAPQRRASRCSRTSARPATRSMPSRRAARSRTRLPSFRSSTFARSTTCSSAAASSWRGRRRRSSTPSSASSTATASTSATIS